MRFGREYLVAMIIWDEEKGITLGVLNEDEKWSETVVVTINKIGIADPIEITRA